MDNIRMRFKVEPVGGDILNIRQRADLNSAINGTVHRNFFVDKISGKDSDEWWEIRSVSSEIQGFVQQKYLKTVPTVQQTDIPLEDFLDELESNARANGGNTIWLLAVAHAQSGIKNDRDDVLERVGPFRFSENNWKALIEANPDADVHPDQINRWDIQIVIASLAFGYYLELLKAALEPAEPNALQLYTAHVLGTEAASVIAKVEDDTRQLFEVLFDAALDQAAIDFAITKLPTGKTLVADLNQLLYDEFQQGIDVACQLLKIPDIDSKATDATEVLLQIESEPTLLSTEVTVERVSHMFSDAPVRNIEKYLPLILQEMAAVGLSDKPMILMALSTISAETAGFEPISEFKSQYNSSHDGHPFDLYDNRSDLGNRGKPDGESFKGRGFVQLTGRDNYQSIGAKIGLGDELLENPDLANDPTIAARILAFFLKAKKSLIKQHLLEGDLLGARRLVNGGSHGIERFSESFAIGQQKIPNLV